MYRKEEHLCEDCGVLSNCIVHHKDRDRSNNEPNNLKYICTHCHAVEHNIERAQNRRIKDLVDEIGGNDNTNRRLRDGYEMMSDSYND